MRIKGADGHEHNVTGQGQGTYNTIAGSAGLASFLGINAGNFLNGGCNNGWGRNVNNCGCSAQDMPITRYEATMMQEMGAKDSKIALLESNIYTDSKIADVYERLNVKINANKEAQDAVNMQQAVYNGTNTATLKSLQRQIDELQGLSELVVPRRKVCNTCCECE